MGFFLWELFVSERGKSHFFSFLLTVSFIALSLIWLDKLINEVACDLIKLKLKFFGLIKKYFVLGSKSKLRKTRQYNVVENLYIIIEIMAGFVDVNTIKLTTEQKRHSLDYIKVSFAMFWLLIKYLSWLFTCLLFTMSNEGKNKNF